MKTSFYFVLWIIIYPILGLFHNSVIDNNDFIIALLIVWGISFLLNKSMPNILGYERALEVSPILEDVYTGNVSSFLKRLSRETLIATVTAVYFVVTTVVIALTMLSTGVNDWLALIIFGLFTWGAIMRSVTLLKAKTAVKDNPTPEECMEIADETYKLNYASYYDSRIRTTYEGMMPPKPKNFKVFQILSLILAIICSIFGIVLLVISIVSFIKYVSIFEALSLAVMYFLYGTLATYFGIKDTVDIFQKLRSQPKSIQK